MQMDNYRNFTIEDFVENERFRKWVHHSDVESNLFWEAFLEKYPDQVGSVDSAKNILAAIKKNFITQDQAGENAQSLQSLKNLKGRIQNIEKNKRIIKLRRITAIGLTASVLIIGGLFLRLQKSSEIVYSTGNAKRMTIVLPDSSVVKLNANSTLTYIPEDWKGTDRSVNLKGEAYFLVMKKPRGVKFHVYSGDLDVSVLGTSFNVKTRNNKSEVVLSEGDIRLGVGDQTFNMVPGDLISYSNSDNKIEAKKVKAIDYIAWKDGITVFNNSLLEVTKELESIFGIEFVFEVESLLERQVQISSPTDDISQVLEILSLVYKNEIEIKRVDKKIFINKPKHKNL